MSNEKVKKEKRKKSKKSDGITTQKQSFKASESSNLDGFAWLICFIPALLYYLFLRSNGSDGGTGSMSKGRGVFSQGKSSPVVSKSVNCLFSKCEGLSNLFYVKEKKRNSEKIETYLTQPVQEILSASNNHFFQRLNFPIWIHDEELGRGFLLMSDISANRIWRWEVGGGPITIGRTLHMERSGCRSNQEICTKKSENEMEWLKGSAGLVMTTASLSSKSSSGITTNSLIVSELGENRIVRIEEDGARTPLVKPTSAWDLLYIPTFQDLIFTVTESSSTSKPNCLYALRQIHKIPPIRATESRTAHYWNETKHNNENNNGGNLDIIYHGQSEDSQLTGIALSHDYKSVFALEKTQNDGLLVVKINLEEDLIDEDEDEEEIKENDNDEKDDTDVDSDSDEDTEEVIETIIEKEDPNKCKSSIFFDATDMLSSHKKYAPSTISAGGIEVDIHGNIYVAIHPIGIVVINGNGDHVGTIPIFHDSKNNDDSEVNAAESNDIITNLAFGEDNYLYVTTTTRLLRMKVRTGVKGMTMNVVEKSGHVHHAWINRCSSSIP